MKSTNTKTLTQTITQIKQALSSELPIHNLTILRNKYLKQIRKNEGPKEVLKEAVQLINTKLKEEHCNLGGLK